MAGFVVYAQGPSGGGGGIPFYDNVNGLAPNSRINRIIIAAQERVQCIHIFTVDEQDLGQHGICGGNFDVFTLPDNDFITSVTGVSGDRVESIEFETWLGGCARFGGPGGFKNYEFHAPPGLEIFGFFGRSGDEIDAIGVYMRRHVD